MLQRSDQAALPRAEMPEHITSCWDRSSKRQTRSAPLPLVVLGAVFPWMEVDCWRSITH